jgi:hypothetical protein
MELPIPREIPCKNVFPKLGVLQVLGTQMVIVLLVVVVFFF